MRLSTVALVVFVAAACGADAMEVEEYFTELEAAAMRFDRSGTDLGTQYEISLSNGIAALQGELDLNDPAQMEEFAVRATALGISTTVDLLSARTDGYERFLSELGSLRPPPIAAAAHEDAVAAGEDALASVPSTLEAVRGIGSIDELGAVVTASPFGEAQLRLGDACRMLQAVADQEEVDVDLGCPDR